MIDNRKTVKIILRASQIIFRGGNNIARWGNNSYGPKKHAKRTRRVSASANNPQTRNIDRFTRSPTFFAISPRDPARETRGHGQRCEYYSPKAQYCCRCAICRVFSIALSTWVGFLKTSMMNSATRTREVTSTSQSSDSRHTFD